MASKEVSTGAGASALIAIIAGFLILYVLFIPEDFRQELLGDGFPGSTTQVPGIDTDDSLVSQSPGRLDRLSKDEIDLSLTPAVLRARTESKVIAKSNVIFTSNSLFTAREDHLFFDLEDPKNTENVLLTFRAREYDGRLSISVNEQIVFNSEITSPTIPPIKINPLILQVNNRIDFRAASAGWKFWHTNKDILEDIKIVADLTDKSTLEANSLFVLTAEELRNMEKVRVRFVPECDPREIGLLELLINDNVVLSKSPLCGEVEQVEFLADNLKIGENELTFASRRGSYVIDQIQVHFKLREADYPIYFFEMKKRTLEGLKDNDHVGVIAELQFASPGQKNVALIVNGHSIAIDTKEIEYDINIESYVQAGTNSVKLVPRRGTVDITRFTVDVK